MPRTKQAVTYRLDPQLIERLQALARERRWKTITAVETLLDEGLTRLGFPPPGTDPEPRHADLGSTQIGE